MSSGAEASPEGGTRREAWTTTMMMRMMMESVKGDLSGGQAIVGSLAGGPSALADVADEEADGEHDEEAHEQEDDQARHWKPHFHRLGQVQSKVS